MYYGLLLLRDMEVLAGDRMIYMMFCIVFLFLGELFVYVLTFPKFQAEPVMASIFSFLYAPVMLSHDNAVKTIHNPSMARNQLSIILNILITL